MAQEPEKWFMLTYRLSDRSLVVQEFDGDYERAADAYTSSEQTHRGESDVEVVLVGADSLETIRRTHSHYFFEEFAQDFFGQLLAAGTRVLVDPEIHPGGL